MKKIREITLLCIKIAAVLLAALFCITRTAEVRDAVYDAVIRCLTVIIPSLYGMMIISGFLVKSNLTSHVPRLLTAPGRLLFGMNSSVFPVFLLSMFAGYPVGAKMLCTECEKGIISRRDGSLFAGVCYGAGPAFVFGCISSQLYGSSAAGRIIIASTAAANVILAFFLSFTMRKNVSEKHCTEKINLSADVLTGSILSGGRSMANICLMSTAFAVFAAFLKEAGITAFAAEALSELTGISAADCSGLLLAALDITAVGELPANNYSLLPMICGLTSFGGICVIMQIAALTCGKLSIKPLVLIRISAAVISTAICRLLLPLMLAEETVSAAEISFAVHSEPSVVPSLLLILMTLILFSEYEKLDRRSM